MTVDVAQFAPLRRPREDVALIGMPILMAIAGLILRYIAYLSTSRADPAGYAAALCVWDCDWYANIVTQGYQAYPQTGGFRGPGGLANWAFFPLFPMVVAGVGKVLPLPAEVLGAIVSPVLTLAAALLSRPLFEGNRRAYLLFCAMLLIGPVSFYYSTLYSESLFILLTITGFLMLRQQHYIAAGAVGALLSATRVTGLFFAVAIIIAAARARWSRRDGAASVAAPSLPVVLLAVVLAPLGLFAFMAYLDAQAGDALGFAHIQRGWDRVVGNPLGYLWGALVPLTHGRFGNAQIFGLAALGGLVLAGVLAVRRQYEMAAFCVLALLAGLVSGVESMPRFVAGLAPIGIVVAQLLARWRWLFWLSLIAFAVLDYRVTIGWMHQSRTLM